ncbi:MAG: 3-dehydroquinate synthase [Chryseobacterium sp.]|nr:MAG: 3-dehydroquinate synthase [Chryseobacterium sp.]
MITFSDGSFAPINDYLQRKKPTKIFFLVDENTHSSCLPVLLPELVTEVPYEILEISAGEEMKTLETTAQLWEILSEFGADRHSLLINLGGGVVSDLGGFIASTFKRGFPFINIPTSLLGMVDASIGGKTGVDLNFYKNLIGTFALPEQICLYPQFLKTLTYIELRSGFAEMLKHGIVASREHWNKLSSTGVLSVESIAPYIKDSADIKQSIVDQDFRETGIRKILNFGHTVGHAIESYFLKIGKPVPHGEAVAAGMICEAQLAREVCGLHSGEVTEIVTTIDRFYPRLSISEIPMATLIHTMQQDKKNIGSAINFSLPEAIGKCRYNVCADETAVVKALEYYISGR